MATIYSHAVAGLGLAQLYVPARLRWLYWALAAFLAVLPDFDAFSSAAYGAILGHRGFTHSLMFSLWIALLAASLTFRRFQANFWALAGVLFLAAASHGFLDALTWGGMSIPFFWPLTDQRFGNWGPIALSDIAFEIPDPRRSRALQSELFWVWLPTGIFVGLVVLYRFVRRRRLAGGMGETGALPEKSPCTRGPSGL